EIYDKILYDETQHTSIASMADDVLFFTYNGLSKNYRAAGYRSGWMIISGAKHRSTDLIEGIEMLSNMRLCANVPAQLAIQTSLGGYQSINDLVAPGGRLYEQRETAWKMLNDIPGVSCVKPKGALYLFPKLDPKRFPIVNDEKLVLDLLLQEKILLVQGSAFNIDDKQHLRVVFLPREDTMADAMGRLGNFLEHYRQ
ncbi:MAG: alanine-synthesizing transaminase, partial [Marinobacter sp. T13-3]